MVGSRVGELIGEGQLIYNWEAYPEDVAALVHAHPTQNKAMGEAHLALAGKPSTRTPDSKETTMATSVTMPQLGESVTGELSHRWLKEVGDEVTADEPLLEVSTDKVDTEIPAPASGVLTEIKAGEGRRCGGRW